jgi:nickel-dependent lactate racemase
MNNSDMIQEISTPGLSLDIGQVRRIVGEACCPEEYRGTKVLVIVPDATRTAPVDMVFKSLFEQIGSGVACIDVMIALGTHQPMSENEIRKRLGLSEAERQAAYSAVQFINHSWDDADELRHIGTISKEEVRVLSGGKFEMDVRVEINRKIFDYDRLIIIGPVFPHEVVGFSGGNKYLFPGVGGPEILNFFHWLGAVISNPEIIGRKMTPVRQVVDRAGTMVDLFKRCFCMVVNTDGGMSGLFFGPPEQAWSQAVDLSATLHIRYKEKPFKTVLSCSPTMYQDLWTGGKCMYKLEPVLAQGGELIIYAPHISEVSVTHAAVIEEIGYHCRDYFLKQWERFKEYPWGVLAHSSHVYGAGSFENGVETPRVRVTLATGISPEKCHQINLAYRDPESIDIESFDNREEEGILLVRKAGEHLYRLKE